MDQIFIAFTSIDYVLTTIEATFAFAVVFTIFASIFDRFL